jgi:hypothetical protein
MLQIIIVFMSKNNIFVINPNFFHNFNFFEFILKFNLYNFILFYMKIISKLFWHKLNLKKENHIFSCK